MSEPTTNSQANIPGHTARADDVPASGEAAAHARTDASRRGSAVDREEIVDADAVMSRVRVELAKRAAATDGWFDPSTEMVTGARWRPAAPRLPIMDQFTLADFLRFDDEDFIDVAYRTLLRRPANDEGSRSCLDALQRGAVSKVEVLGSIRFSEEGRRQSVHVDGLLRPYTLRRWQRLPVLGWFLGMGMALARLPRLVLRLHAIEASAARETQALGRWVNRVDAAVAKRLLHAEDDLRTLRDELDKANAELKATTAKLESHEATLAALNERLRND